MRNRDVFLIVLVIQSSLSFISKELINTDDLIINLINNKKIVKISMDNCTNILCS